MSDIVNAFCARLICPESFLEMSDLLSVRTFRVEDPEKGSEACCRETFEGKFFADFFLADLIQFVDGDEKGQLIPACADQFCYAVENPAVIDFYGVVGNFKRIEKLF